MAIDAILSKPALHGSDGSYYHVDDIRDALMQLPSAEKHTEIHAYDLISRVDAIDAIKASTSKYTGFMEMEMYTDDDAVEAIESLPSAEPERKTGRWILHENQRQEDVDNGNYLYICSECGKSDIHAKTQKVPFCWWCGSSMEDKR